jgi:hypothetical protein
MPPTRLDEYVALFATVGMSLRRWVVMERPGLLGTQIRLEATKGRPFTYGLASILSEF